MNPGTLISRVSECDTLNFWLTNRIPRRLLTHFMGWFSQIENPWLCRWSIAIWKLFADLDLSEAATTEFPSLHACFTRQLQPGARPIHGEESVIVSPSDGIVGACGAIEDGLLLQAKGFPYSLTELLCDADLARSFQGGAYVTLRLKSSMYHRFHAPHDCRIDRVTYVTGDTWNVNPAALKRVEKLFCKNERAIIQARLAHGDHRIALVPVAAILVASIRLHFLDVLLHLKYRGPHVIDCQAAFGKGEEMGWFQHGSTIILLAPAGFSLGAEIREGLTIRMGQPLMVLP